MATSRWSGPASRSSPQPPVCWRRSSARRPPRRTWDLSASSASPSLYTHPGRWRRRRPRSLGTLQVVRRGLYGHPPRHLAHGREERQRPVRRLDRLVGDGVDPTLHQELREPLVSGQMQVGEELMTLPEAVVFLGYGLLDLDDQIGRLEDLLRSVDETRTSLLVLPVGEASAFASTGLDIYIVAVMYQLGDAVRLHGDTALHVLDLLRNPYYRRHSLPFPRCTHTLPTL